MEKFIISSEECLILTALAKTSSLREAARLLGCDAGGLLRKVQYLGEQHGVVQKINGKWVLTQEGVALVGWTQESIARQKELLESNLTIRIATTTWLAEQVLIPGVEHLKKSIPKLQKVQFINPEKNFEKSLLEADCDFAVVCHPPNDPSIAHSQIRDEPWSIVMSRFLAEKHQLKPHTMTIEDLQDIPFVHHQDLNPESFLPRDFAIQQSSFSANNLISIRSALVHNLGWSFVPKALVLNDLESKHLFSFDPHLKMDRKICVWWARGARQGKRNNSIFCRWVAESCSKF